MFSGQQDKAGLGFGKHKKTLSTPEFRKLMSQASFGLAEEKRVLHSHQLARQGNWLRYAEDVIPFDFSWKNLIYGTSSHLIKFVVLATINWIKTPDLMALWGKLSNGDCKLCKYSPCSIHHILSSCRHSLKDRRYAWRHDSVLLAMEQGLRSAIDRLNKLPPPKPCCLQILYDLVLR